MASETVSKDTGEPLHTLTDRDKMVIAACDLYSNADSIIEQIEGLEENGEWQRYSAEGPCSDVVKEKAELNPLRVPCTPTECSLFGRDCSAVRSCALCPKKQTAQAGAFGDFPRGASGIVGGVPMPPPRRGMTAGGVPLPPPSRRAGAEP